MAKFLGTFDSPGGKGSVADAGSPESRAQANAASSTVAKFLQLESAGKDTPVQFKEGAWNPVPGSSAGGMVKGGQFWWPSPEAAAIDAVIFKEEGRVSEANVGQAIIKGDAQSASVESEILKYCFEVGSAAYRFAGPVAFAKAERARQDED